MKTDMGTFHDYELLSIVHDPKAGGLQLTVRSPSGSLENLVFHGCTKFRVCDFIYQNVIYELIFSSGSEIDGASARRSLDWLWSFSDTSSSLTKETAEKILSEIRAGKLVLVECVPSYGAEFVALCRSYEVKRDKLGIGEVLGEATRSVT